MDPKTASTLLARAEAALLAGTPSLRATRVPDGLAVALPLERGDGDLVLVYVVPAGHGLRLVDDGAGIPELDASGRLPEDGSWRETLDRAGLAYDDEACEVFADVPDIEAIHARAMAMGRALHALSEAGDAGAAGA